MNEDAGLEIRGFFSSDVTDLVTWAPKTIDALYMSLEIYIGEKGVDGSDIFSALVCSPEALRKHEYYYKTGRHLLIVPNYDWDEIKQTITQIVASCQGGSWTEAVARLSRYFRWEYEDYSET